MAEFLADILNTEMDTLIEDGSLELVCGALCNGFRACAAGREHEVTAELAKLPATADLSGCRQVRHGKTMGIGNIKGCRQVRAERQTGKPQREQVGNEG